MTSYKVKYSIIYRVVGWLGLLLFTSMLFIPWEEVVLPFTLLGLFILLSLYVLIEAYSVIEINENGIYQRKLFGLYGIRWEEIKSIFYASDGEGFTWLVLEGENKRLSIAGPGDWSYTDELATKRFLCTEIKRRGLEIKEELKAIFRFSKNVRLS